MAEGCLGPAARLIATRLWWSFPSHDASASDLALASLAYHYDLDDWAQLKVFFYLTPVGPSQGPHVYVLGSHRRRTIKEQLRPFVGRSDAALKAQYPPEAFTQLTGEAGEGFIEDPFGYHKGEILREGRRLILELSFGLNDLLAARRYGAVPSRSARA